MKKRIEIYGAPFVRGFFVKETTTDEQGNTSVRTRKFANHDLCLEVEGEVEEEVKYRFVTEPAPYDEHAAELAEPTHG